MTTYSVETLSTRTLIRCHEAGMSHDELLAHLAGATVDRIEWGGDGDPPEEIAPLCGLMSNDMEWDLDIEEWIIYLPYRWDHAQRRWLRRITEKK